MCEKHRRARNKLFLLIWKKRGRVRLEEMIKELEKEGTLELSDGLSLEEWLEIMMEQGLVKRDADGSFVF